MPGFVPELSRKIYAGADIFLMPSKSEPCGLSQMIALRYGTIPVVRETGGLKDSITDSGDGQGNGFTFKTYNTGDMLHSLHRAIYATTPIRRAGACWWTAPWAVTTAGAGQLTSISACISRS